MYIKRTRLTKAESSSLGGGGGSGTPGAIGPPGAPPKGEGVVNGPLMGLGELPNNANSMPGGPVPNPGPAGGGTLNGGGKFGGG